jgi:hypothetical protein
MNQPKWQRAKIIHANGMPEFIGRYLWTEIGHLDRCGGNFCTLPAIYVNHEFESPFGPAQDVNHLCDLEMLNEFADELPMLSWKEFVAGKER